jgi:predicted dehydrogenase
MEVAAVVTSNPARVREAAAAHPGAEVLASADAIWENRDRYDLVVVAAPNRAHAALAEASLRAGLAVVVDKPMATTLDQARRLESLSRQTGVLLSVFHNRRWDNDFLTVRRLVAEGTLGSLVRYESRFERFRPEVDRERWRESPSPEEGGGLLLDLGSHLIDQALLLFGRPTHVYAEVERRREHAQVDDDTFVALRFAAAPIAHLWAGALAYRPGPRLRLTGARGLYERFGLDPQEEALRSGMRPSDEGWGEEPETAWGRLSAEGDGGPIDERVRPELGAYERFYALLRDALRHGGDPPVGPDEGVAVLEVIEAARTSAQERKVVALRD